jgi:hypothetical protein
MISTDLARLFEMPGPFVSLYLDHHRQPGQPADPGVAALESLRHELAHTGAPKATMAAVDPLIDGPHTAGDMLVAIANLDGIQLLAHLPDAPPRDVARCGMLPDVAPLLAWRQPQLPYVVVATDRLGAELLAVVPTGPDREVRVERQELHVTRSAPGGWSQRRFQQQAENRWQQNAGAVAEALTRLVARCTLGSWS